MTEFKRQWYIMDVLIFSSLFMFPGDLLVNQFGCFNVSQYF